MGGSALERLLDWAVAGTDARACVWDVSGIGRLHPDLAADFNRYQMHTSALCAYTKSTDAGWRRCIRCKSAAAHRALQEGTFVGRCHMGLTEVVVPVLHEGELVAVLHGGQVHAARHDGLAQREIDRRARRIRVDPRRLAEADRAVPRIGPAVLAEVRDRLEVVRRFVEARVAASPARLKPGEPLRAPQLDEIGALRGRARWRWLTLRAKEFARLEYHKPLTTSRVARRLGAPLALFCRAFKAEAGVPFKAYLLTARLEAARRLLQRDRATVTYAALETGFRSPGYFARSFTRTFGLSPREFRLQRWRRGNRQSSAGHRQGRTTG